MKTYGGRGYGGFLGEGGWGSANKGLEVEMRPSNGKSDQRGREVLLVSWKSPWERGKIGPESGIQKK